MVGDLYETFDDPYCYAGTTVLRNIPDLHDPAALEQFELEMVALRIEEGPPAGNFTTGHYRAIHRHLFQDVYVWAGKYRTVRTTKGCNPFCFPENIKEQMEQKFAWLNEAVFFAGEPVDHFIAALAKFLAELNAIHPFREGNGRTQLQFVRMLGQRAGESFRLEAIEAEPFLGAMIASYNLDLDPLVDELQRMLA